MQKIRVKVKKYLVLSLFNCIKHKLMSLLKSELMPFFQQEQEHLFPATKAELLALAEREGFSQVLIDSLSRLPDDNTVYESLEEIFEIPEDELEYYPEDEIHDI